MGRDIFHCPRLLQALSSLALDTCRDPGAARASLGILCQGLPTLPGKNFFLISHLILSSVSVKPFHLVLLSYSLKLESLAIQMEEESPAVCGRVGSANRLGMALMSQVLFASQHKIPRAFPEQS